MQYFFPAGIVRLMLTVSLFYLAALLLPADLSPVQPYEKTIESLQIEAGSCDFFCEDIAPFSEGLVWKWKQEHKRSSSVSLTSKSQERVQARVKYSKSAPPLVWTSI